LPATGPHGVAGAGAGRPEQADVPAEGPAEPGQRERHHGRGDRHRQQAGRGDDQHDALGGRYHLAGHPVR
jgi:hypothetical protein